MKFYSIRNSLNRKVIGKYPQTIDIHYNCHVWDEPKFVEHIHFAKVDFEPITANAILDPKAKQTDLINANGAMGFSTKLLLSGKLKSILEKNRQNGMQFFNAPIIQNNIMIDDFWVLNVYEVNYELVDFQNSIVFETKNTFNLDTELKIKSCENFYQKKRDINKKGYPYGILIVKVALTSQCNSHFFTLLNVEGGVKYIVSEKLKKEIEDAGCTGIEFQPIELSYNEWTAPGGEREKVYGKA